MLLIWHGTWRRHVYEKHEEIKEPEKPEKVDDDIELLILELHKLPIWEVESIEHE